MDACTVRANHAANEDFIGVFLTHARLYVLAEKYWVESLKSLTLHKIHRTLMLFTPYGLRIGDVIKLIQSVYSDAKTPEIDELGALVVLYTVYEDVLLGP